MNDLNSDGKGRGDDSTPGVRPGCCQTAEGQGASCCTHRGGSWGKGKALLAGLIILAAIGVGAVSFMRGNAAQGVAAAPGSSCPTPCAAAARNNPAVGGTAPQTQAANPGSCPTQSGAASCTNSGVKGTSNQAVASTSSSSLVVKEITIFGKQSCPFTVNARKAKSKEGLTVIYKDVIENPQAMEEMLRLTNGNRSVPVLVAGGQVSIGFGGS